VAHHRAGSGSLTPAQRAVLWRDSSDPPGEPPFPVRGTLARRGGVECWELQDRCEEREWRHHEEAHDRWRVQTIARVREGLA
jgi:hypothetical protein